MHIRAAKAVDGLLGIADQDQGGTVRAAGIGIKRPKDIELGGIGVLEFINQGHRKTCAQGAGQAASARALQRRTQTQR